MSALQTSGTRLIAICSTRAAHDPMQKPVGLLLALAYTPRR